MTLFQYTVRQVDGKEIVGSLESPSEEEARDTLAERSLEIISIGEASRKKDEEPSSSLSSVFSPPGDRPVLFAYEGNDDDGVTHHGTIEAVSKRNAFESITSSKGLKLTQLSPLGVTPIFNDPDLLTWQSSKKESVNDLHTDAISSSSLSPTPISLPHHQSSALSTLRLYAGWLLAWYIFFAVFGYYVTMRVGSINIPFSQAFFFSPLLLKVAIGSFFFLFLQAVLELITSVVIRIVVGIGMISIAFITILFISS